jgi:methylmalonyl-CoA carboxyltransferase large subunit
MKAETVELTKLTAMLEAMGQELSRLGERVAALETAGRTVPTAIPARERAAEKPAAVLESAQAPSSARAVEGLSEEVVLVISAAIAGYLGKKPHIRQIRLIGTGAWAQQGRVMIQASHAFKVHSART